MVLLKRHALVSMWSVKFYLKVSVRKDFMWSFAYHLPIIFQYFPTFGKLKYLPKWMRGIWTEFDTINIIY